VRAQLRRARGDFGAREPLRIGSVELDAEARRVTVAGREVELTRREFDLLAALVRDPDRAHTRDARQEARTIVAQVQAGADTTRLNGLQELLANDQITVYRGGRIVFQGPARTGREFELRAEARFPGGLVSVADHASPESSTTRQLTLITAGVLALVTAAAIGTATLVARAVRRPVQRRSTLPSGSPTATSAPGWAPRDRRSWSSWAARSMRWQPA
jgi:hypothetical protein